MNRAEYLSTGWLASVVRGNDLPHAKLDADRVREIRANRHGMTMRQLAEKYGVHHRTIQKIQYHQSWTHI